MNTNGNTLPAVAAVNLPAARIETVVAQRKAIMQAIKEAMTENVHYGAVPGCGDKKTCLKPGAEMLCLMFGLRPQFEHHIEHQVSTIYPNGHMEVVYTCTLYSPDNQIMGQGIGSCSTLESKYRYRNAALKCPECGKESIIKGKKEYGGGWICFAKKGGCGAKWPDGAAEIEKQERGKIENLDIADQYNTVRKMAKKRAHVDAALTTTGASEFFTQDVEDFPEYVDVKVEAQPELKTAKPEPKPAQAPRTIPPNERIEPDLAPDKYKLQAPKSQHKGKELMEIHRADPKWIPAVLSDKRRAAACTQRDMANLQAFAAVMQPVGGNGNTALMAEELAAMDDEGLFNIGE